MARTITAVGTYARFALLELQVRYLLREAAGASEQTLERVSKGLAAPHHYIEIVAVRGLYPNKTIGAELRIQIDWRQYEIALKAGGTQLAVPSTWANDVAPSLSEAVRTFSQAVEIASLETELIVTYARHFSHVDVNAILGFRSAQTRIWAREPDYIPLGFGPLTEASLVVGIAID